MSVVVNFLLDEVFFKVLVGIFLLVELFDHVDKLLILDGQDSDLILELFLWGLICMRFA
jgi:hypothetical protein